MSITSIILPVSGAAAGLLTGAAMTGPVLKKLSSTIISGDFAGKIANLISKEKSTVDPIREQLTSPKTIEPLIPFIENHIDDFLRNRLKIAIPMIGMLIGDRTIAQLKEVFMKELESILPQVIDEYIGGMKDRVDVEQILNAKLQTIPQATINSFLRPHIIKMLLLTGVIAGLFAGLVNVLIVLALEPPHFPAG